MAVLVVLVVPSIVGVVGVGDIVSTASAKDEIERLCSESSCWVTTGK